MVKIKCKKLDFYLVPRFNLVIFNYSMLSEPIGIMNKICAFKIVFHLSQ